tara:strand:- start:37 stop:783 length:747 start_codon:yes stop_codon:yes gene_type:complete
MKFGFSLFCALFIIGLSGCPVGVDRTMLVIHGAMPLPGGGACDPLPPATSTGYLTKGILELAVGQTDFDYNMSLHMSYPFTDVPTTVNPQFPNYGNAPTSNNLSIREAEFLIETEEDLAARLATDTEFEWDTITATQEPFFVPIPYTSPLSAGDFIGTIILPLTNLVAPPIVGDSTTLMIHLVVRARTLDGDDVESSVLHFPIDVCNGCLSNVTCPAGTVASPVNVLPCFVGQDDPLVACVLPEDAEG